jgi:hypothetical protein
MCFTKERYHFMSVIPHFIWTTYKVIVVVVVGIYKTFRPPRSSLVIKARVRLMFAHDLMMLSTPVWLDISGATRLATSPSI